MMMGAALDEAGQPILGTEVSTIIQRRVESVDGNWIEHADTRLLPGQTALLEIPWPQSGVVQVWLEVHPDDFYEHQVYAELSRDLPKNSAAGQLIMEADRRAKANRYRLFETTLHRP